jgi:DNA anti-recombination protein RmuC
MTQTITPTDPTVAALQESVRHNEKNIDRLDRDLKDFRSETLKQFEKVDQRFDKIDDRLEQLKADVSDRFNQLEAKFDQRFEKIDDRLEQLKADVSDRFNQLETKTDQRFDKINDRFNQITMLLVAIVGLIVAAIVKLVFLS